MLFLFASFFSSFKCFMILFSELSSDLKDIYKQAYTNELEIKVSHLEEENERLRKRKVRSVL